MTFETTDTRRRHFLTRTVVAGASLALPEFAAAAPPPETTRIRLARVPTVCLAPQYLADDLLRAEGFTDIEYVPLQAGSARYSRIWLANMVAEGLVDITMNAAPGLITLIDAGAPISVIAGIHAGCYELFGHRQVQSIRDMRHRRFGIAAYGEEKLFLSSMLAYVGMDPDRDVQWVTSDDPEAPMRWFEEGKVDAFLAFPPQPQVLRARRIGHMFLSTATDKPWSQYYCCLVAANRHFLQHHPVAAKRALRAFLKATDLCATDPARAARLLVDKGYVPDYRDALGLLRSLPYDRWREANPADTVRFYALRMKDVRLIARTPQEILARGTDWRFLDALKREMRA